MKPRHVLTCVVLLGSLALGWEIGGADRFGKRSFEAEEAARLRLHFAEVERGMSSRDVSDLTLEQRVARTEQIRQLHRYAAAGAFPRNTYHPGTRTPYFRDAHGNLCAMAFLIAASGRGDIVDHIARNRNYAFVPDLVDEPGLAEWLTDHGLTVAEAARIQPSYDGNPCCVLDDPPQDPGPGRGYVAASAGTSALSAISIAWNARSLERVSNERWKGFFGAGVGGANLILGLSRLSRDGWKNQSAAIWNVAIGATAAVLGGRAIFANPRVERQSSARLSVTPLAMTGARPGLGFLGRLSF